MLECYCLSARHGCTKGNHKLCKLLSCIVNTKKWLPFYHFLISCFLCKHNHMDSLSQFSFYFDVKTKRIDFKLYKSI